jgi:hypothetical protein
MGAVGVFLGAKVTAAFRGGLILELLQFFDAGFADRDASLK